MWFDDANKNSQNWYHNIHPSIGSDGWGLWYLTSLSIIFKMYRGGQFYWWRKLGYQEKMTDLAGS